MKDNILIDDGTSIYELDGECISKKRQKEKIQEADIKDEQKKKAEADREVFYDDSIDENR